MRIALVVVALLICAIVLDQVIAIGSRSLPVSSLRYDGGGFRIGAIALTFAGLDNLRSDVELSVNLRNQVQLSARGASFPLGLRLDAGDSSGRPDIDFAPNPGDRVSLTERKNLFGWPTPFEFKILGGRSPWWKQYVYYRLEWQKSSGENLEMRWRYERQYYSGTGWTEPAMLWMSRTGLVAVEIGRR